MSPSSGDRDAGGWRTAPRRPIAWWRHALMALGLVAVIGGYDHAVWRNEKLLADGDVVRLELAPRDPRALLTGDYMALNYRLARDIEKMVGGNDRERGDALASRDGYAVVRLDERRVATLVRTQPAATPPPGSGERLLHYRLRESSVRIGTNAWYFEEGSVKRFEPARFGEFRVAGNGRMLLTTMLGEDLKPL
ncbi:MAG TPA: GDYXXLXY domain-containing protein [Burkholderiaceae bacterium]|nr:GDYXXLXY domain-containing protein [Burkholderiaceae bacterium]